jgi:hypothetical protein
MRKFDIYYVLPVFGRELRFGSVIPTIRELNRTHAFVTSIQAEHMEDVFYRMQGEVWSPNGEARPLIERLGLHHTSMSVGDVVHDVERNTHHVVANIGFKEMT